MAEQLALTNPIVVPEKTTNQYQVVLLLLDWGLQNIMIHVLTNNGERLEFRYDGPAALSLMQTLNKANLTIKSLHKRVLEKLAADGLLGAGTVVGAPE